MAQAVLAGKTEVCPLTFIDINGNSMKGPPGIVNSSNPQVSPWMSADFQSVLFNVPTTAGVAFTLTWKDQSGSGVPDFSANFVSKSVIGSFGQASPQ